MRQGNPEVFSFGEELPEYETLRTIPANLVESETL
jgi:hypothetical protein